MFIRITQENGELFGGYVTTHCINLADYLYICEILIEDDVFG